jgi:hypothetical protein
MKLQAWALIGILSSAGFVGVALASDNDKLCLPAVELSPPFSLIMCTNSGDPDNPCSPQGGCGSQEQGEWIPGSCVDHDGENCESSGIFSYAAPTVYGSACQSIGENCADCGTFVVDPQPFILPSLIPSCTD